MMLKLRRNLVEITSFRCSKLNFHFVRNVMCPVRSFDRFHTSTCAENKRASEHKIISIKFVNLRCTIWCSLPRRFRIVAVTSTFDGETLSTKGWITFWWIVLNGLVFTVSVMKHLSWKGMHDCKQKISEHKSKWETRDLKLWISLLVLLNGRGNRSTFIDTCPDNFEMSMKKIKKKVYITINYGATWFIYIS